MAAKQEEGNDRGRCGRCGGRIAATHMLTRTYELDDQGRWRRRLADFVEDVVVVCSGCGEEPDGRFESDDNMFAFVPTAAHREAGQDSR